MKIFVLSLKNETGEKRRKRLNYDYEVFWGTDKLSEVPDFIKNKMLIRHNVKNKEDLLRRKSCGFYGYFKILEKIVNENIYNCIICEDDAILRDKQYLNCMMLDNNEDEAILLNAKLHHPKNYNKDKSFNENNIKFDLGIQKIDYEKYRWSCCACIYYPSPLSAKKVLNHIYESKSLTYLDLELSKKKIIKNLYYPSPFIIDDEGVSQISGSKGVIKDYKVI